MIIREKPSQPLLEDFVKVVVDIERRIASAGCDLHIDCADELIADGSEGRNLWGANVYPPEKNIDFVSLINIRPADDNRSMEIQLPEVRANVEAIIRELLF